MNRVMLTLFHFIVLIPAGLPLNETAANRKLEVGEVTVQLDEYSTADWFTLVPTSVTVPPPPAAFFAACQAAAPRSTLALEPI